jgi:hypothetical protein
LIIPMRAMGIQAKMYFPIMGSPPLNLSSTHNF